MSTPDTPFSIAPNTWGHKKIKLKNKFGHLNDVDLLYVVGQERELTARLSSKLNMSEADVQRLINAL